MMELTEDQKANALWSIYTSAGLKVVLEIMETVALESETALLGQRPWTPEVQGLQAIAHANRVMFQDVRDRIEQLVSGRPISVPTLKPRTLDERATDNAELTLGPEDIQ